MKKEYAILIDHLSEYSANEHYEPIIIKASTIIEAMEVAEAHMDETVYLIKILEKKAGTEKCEGCRKYKFEEILVNRTHGWHKADSKHSENSSTWNHVVSTSRSFKWDSWEIESTTWS